MFERAGHCSIATVGYEPHPDFCTHCQVVEHSFHSCRSRKKDFDKPRKEDNTDHQPQPGGPDTDKHKNSKWVRKEDHNFGKDNNDTPPSENTDQNTQIPDHNGSKDNLYVIIRDHHFRFDPIQSFTTTSGAIQFVGLVNPVTSWGNQQRAISGAPSQPTHDATKYPVDHTWSLRSRISPTRSMPTLAITETATSNTFTAIASDEESYDEGSRSEQEEVEEYSNDPLDQHNQIKKSPTPKAKKRKG